MALADAQVDSGALAAKLPLGSALVDFFEYNRSSTGVGKGGDFDHERRFVAFVGRPDKDVARIDLGPADEIEKAIDAWLPALRRQGPYQGEAAAASLKQLVWMPLQTHLNGISSVLVSPYGKLAMVPLGALPGTVEGTFLTEQCEHRTGPRAPHAQSG